MKKIALLLYTVIVLVLAASCDRRAEYLTASGAMLGTTFQATGDITDCTAQELYRAIMQIDAEAKASMSIFDSTSLLSRINRGETDSLDEHIIYNLRLAERFSRLSEGHYDVTVKPLVDTWGFAGHEAERTPNLDSLLQFVGYRRVHIRDGRLVKDDPRVQLDFNSIAKGYTVDLVAALMERCGAKNYLVEIGGECRCQGVSSKGIPWRIGIETPFDGNMSDGAYLTGRIRMSEGGLATSGNYRRFYRDADRPDNGPQRHVAIAFRHRGRGQLRRSRRHGDHVFEPGRGQGHRPLPENSRREGLFYPRRRERRLRNLLLAGDARNDDSRIIPLRTNETSSISL